jgi:predicted RNase H-like HicB family nuclease
MTTEHCILSGYLDHAVSQAEYDKLEDGTYVGRIPSCTGVIAFGESLANCQRELRSTLEDWLLLGIKLGHTLPVIDGIDLNREPVREPLDAL